ncbi:GNAT family acetyltransferase [Arthrobacter sp. MYb227]|uniref:GNAT family acetyltransferase n=1 Tax=Arthrobacter sp. MYb227 TaxID=1848601 RepID=UPI001C611EE0|nr:GNAT family acetyltransferase [Arthrobacter sp. MYb227]
MIEVTTTHLEQFSAHHLIPASRPLPDHARIDLVKEISPEFSKFLYQGVGSEWNWADRLNLPRAEWESLLRTPGTETHVLYVDGAPGGYVELVARAGTQDAPEQSITEVEIIYFGLFPDCIGQGLGGILLTEGIRRAWDIDSRHEGFAPVSRVWVHTCSLDGPAAIANYEARGLAVFHTETERLVPGDGRAGMWPAN